MENIIMDLGSNVNVIQINTWEMMGHLKLICSSIQLRLVNQHNMIRVGRLTGVSINIDGVCSIEDFKVIDIVDRRTPYPTLLGLYCSFDNKTIIDLKKRHMVFKVEDLKVTTLLDPTEGKRYVEPTQRKELDNLYNMTMWIDDYMSPIIEGVVS